MKGWAITRIVGVTVIVVAVAAAVFYLDHLPPSRLAALLGISVTVSDLEGQPESSPTPTPLPADDRVIALSVSTVAVQTFSGPTLVRTAAGTIVSSDGLIVTTSAGAPYGSGSFVYQVATAKGGLLRARRVAFDATTGLVLLKADGEDMDAVELGETPAVRAGDEFTLLGATIALSRYSVVILPATVAYTVGQSEPVLSLDRSFLPVLVGARVVDRSGRTVGLLASAGAPKIIGASAIETFVRRHLNSQ